MSQNLWTVPWDRSALLADDEGMAWLYSLEATHAARHQSRVFGHSPEDFAKEIGTTSYVLSDYLTYLSKHGYDTEQLRSQVEYMISLTESGISDAQKRAQSFFALIQNEWHVTNAQVKSLVDADSIYHILELASVNAAQVKARLKAVKRHQQDPKQADKEFVFECWLAWQRKPNQYPKGKAEFALDMLEKCAHLKSPDVIARWCREWEKSHQPKASG